MKPSAQPLRSTTESGDYSPPDIRRTSIWLGVAGFATVIAAQVFAVATSPAERDMGHLQKIMYVHVPAAWMTFLAFFVVLVFSVRYMWRRNENDDLLAAAAAEVGAVFNGLTLLLGMIWGRPAWGVWWVWDAQLTCALLLLALFLAVVMLQTALDDARRADRAAAVLVLCGLIALPVVYASMVRWGVAPPDTLLAPAMRPGTMDTLLAGMLVMGAGLAAYTVAAALTRLRTMILERERRSEWAAHLAGD